MCVAAKQLKIKLATAKFIIAKYRKYNEIFKKKDPRTPKKPRLKRES